MIIRFDRTPYRPVALFIAPSHDAAGRRIPGDVVGYLGADGEFYGARDVTPGDKRAAILAAWKQHAADQGLPCLDLPDARP